MINGYIVLINHIIFCVSDFFLQSNATNSNFFIFHINKKNYTKKICFKNTLILSQIKEQQTHLHSNLNIHFGVFGTI